MMKKVIALAALMVFAFIMSGISNTDASDTKKSLSGTIEDWMTTYKRGDAAGMAALYTRNGQILPPNGDFVTGTQAIQTFWQALMDMGVKEVELETVETEGHGNTAIEVGKFTLYGDQEQVIDKGKYIVIWKKEAGQWRLHRDIFNSSTPAPGQ